MLFYVSVTTIQYQETHVLKDKQSKLFYKLLSTKDCALRQKVVKWTIKGVGKLIGTRNHIIYTSYH